MERTHGKNALILLKSYNEIVFGNFKAIKEELFYAAVTYA